MYDDAYGGSAEWNGTETFYLEGRRQVADNERIRSKVSYLTNRFVAMKSNEDKNKVSIWIGKVLSATYHEKVIYVLSRCTSTKHAAI